MKCNQKYDKDINVDDGHNICQTAVKEDGGGVIRIIVFVFLFFGLKRISIK
jgi:hypothetical protein